VRHSRLCLLYDIYGTVPDNSSETGIQMVVHTRIVARILLRLGVGESKTWSYVNTVLLITETSHPASVRTNLCLWMQLRAHGIGLIPVSISFDACLTYWSRRYVLAFCTSWAHHHRIDEESGLRNTGSMLVVGACACLVVSSTSPSV
jgi:hypothetical protein